jgi:hypothetical protein
MIEKNYPWNGVRYQRSIYDPGLLNRNYPGVIWHMIITSATIPEEMKFNSLLETIPWAITRQSRQCEYIGLE